MVLHLDLDTHTTLDELPGFLAGNPQGAALVPDRKETYAHVERVLRRFAYWCLSRPDTGLLRRHLERTSGLSRAQLTRLIARYRQDGELPDWCRGPAQPFLAKYGREDILLLAETDELHASRSGPATLEILRRGWEVFGDARFVRLAGLSNGHLYNLRRSRTYVQRVGAKQGTRPARVGIAERRRPQPEGRPGYLRVDSVHQGDVGKVEGVYHINVVDADAVPVRGEHGADPRALPAAAHEFDPFNWRHGTSFPMSADPLPARSGRNCKPIRCGSAPPASAVARRVPLQFVAGRGQPHADAAESVPLRHHRQLERGEVVGELGIPG